MIQASEFSNRISVKDAAFYVSEMLKLVPMRIWCDRASSIEKQWPELGATDILLRRHSLELHMQALVSHYRKTRRYFGRSLSARDVEVVQFAYMLSHLKRATSEKIAKETVLKGLRKNLDLRPVQFELDTMSYGLQRGFDVEPSDYALTARHDFRMVRNGREVAVECKHLMPDAGLPFDEQRVHEFFNQVLQVSRKRKPNLGDWLLSVDADNKIDDFHGLAKRIAHHLASNQECTEAFGSDKFTLKRLSEAQLAKIESYRKTTSDQDDEHSWIADFLEIDNPTIIFMTRREGQTIICSFGTKKRPKTESLIFERLRDDVKDQLPSNLPGVLAVEFAALPPDDFKFFCRREGDDRLVVLTRDLFQRRPHCVSVIYVAGYRLNVGGQPWAHREGRTSFVFKNPNHPLKDDPNVCALL